MMSDPSTTAWLNRLSLGSKIDQPRKSAHLGRNRLPIPGTPTTGFTAHVSLNLRKGSSDVLHRTCVPCSVNLVL